MGVGEVTGFGMNWGMYLKVELIGFADTLGMRSCANAGTIY